MNLFQKNFVKYGLLMSASTIICLAIMELTGQNQGFDKSPLFLVMTVLAPALVMFLGISAKKVSQKGKLTFKEGFGEGFKIAAVFAVTSPFVFLFYYLFVNPSILPYVKQTYQMPDATDATIISMDMGVQFIGALIGETIYGAIISFFLKSKTKK